MEDVKDCPQDGIGFFKDSLSWMSPISAFVGSVTVITVFWLIKKNKRRLPPGPPALPLIGNYSFLGSKPLQETCAELSEKHGPVITIYLGWMPLVVLNTVEVSMEALVQKKADFANRPVLTSINESMEGVKNITYAQYTPSWKVHRKIVGSALRHYLKGETFEKAVHGSITQVKKLFEELNGKPFIPHTYIDYMFFNIMYSTCFHKVFKFDDPKFKHLIGLEEKLLRAIGNGFREDLIPILRKIWPSKNYRVFTETVKELLQFINDEFEEHMTDFDPENIRDFADSLVLAKREAEIKEDAEILDQFTEGHLKQMVAEVFFAGLDVPRFLIYWALLYLADHQDVQRKAQAEIDQFVERDGLCGLNDRNDLPYTEAVMHEMMRIATIGPFGLPHAARVDSTINGYDIPKGTMVVVNHWALHNDPRHWENPGKFDPERHLDSDGKFKQKPESWLPFSAGRRMCLGETAAKKELMLILTRILHQFNIKLPPGVTADYKSDINGYAGHIPNEYKIIVENRF